LLQETKNPPRHVAGGSSGFRDSLLSLAQSTRPRGAVTTAAHTHREGEDLAHLNPFSNCTPDQRLYRPG
jgi:hypothetical protein